MYKKLDNFLHTLQGRSGYFLSEPGKVQSCLTNASLKKNFTVSL
jgi:hypothetical protein